MFGFVKEAWGQYTIDGQVLRLQPGTVYFTNPGHYRSFAYEAIGEAYLITLSEGFLREHVHPDVFEEFPFLLTETRPATTVPPALFAEFERVYLQIHTEYVGHSPFRQRLMGHLFVLLLLKLNEHLYRDYNVTKVTSVPTSCAAFGGPWNNISGPCATARPRTPSGCRTTPRPNTCTPLT